MAITVDWGTKIINVPKADTQLVSAGPPEIRQLDIDLFRLTLKDLEDDEAGMPFLATHSHNTAVTVGGVTLARVVEIINGYTITFEDGQYAVNLVGANSNIADVANVNQVSIRSANSAGLTFSEQINQQSFAGYIWIDTIDGLAGVGFPRGTPTDPVLGWIDAATISASTGLKSFKLRHDITIPAATDMSGLTIEGLNVVGSEIILQGGDSTHLDVQGLSVSGDCGIGFMVATGCHTGVLTSFEGALDNCLIEGNITLTTTSTNDGSVTFFNSASGLPGVSTFTLDCGDTNNDIQFRNWSGGMVITNFTSGNLMSIDMAQGKVTLDATCTAGTILVRGVAELVDNSGVGCTVVQTGTVTALVAAGSITEQDKDDIAARIIPQIWAAS